MSALPVCAQNCGITTVTETTPLLYPAIARAAHVEGTVILMVDFSREGKPENIAPLSGPQMLRQRAIDFVQGWQVNPYGGPRSCPVIILFKVGSDSLPKYRRSDPQHVILIGAAPPCLCDPAGVLAPRRRRWYWPF